MNEEVDIRPQVQSASELLVLEESTPLVVDFNGVVYSYNEILQCPEPIRHVTSLKSHAWFVSESGKLYGFGDNRNNQVMPSETWAGDEETLTLFDPTEMELVKEEVKARGIRPPPPVPEPRAALGLRIFGVRAETIEM